MTGSVDEGATLASAALEEAERLGTYPVAAIALSVLAIARAMAGDAVGERSFYERRLAVVSEHGDVARIADTLNTLAEIALDEADAATARAYASESLVIAGSALILEARDATITLARAAAVDDDPARTALHLRAALGLADRTGQSLALAQCLRVGGCLAVLRKHPEAAVRAFAAAQEVSPSPSGSDEPIEADFAARLGEARSAIGEDGFRREWQLGRSLPAELCANPGRSPAHTSGSVSPESTSSRLLTIARLPARGHAAGGGSPGRVRVPAGPPPEPEGPHG